MNKEEVSALVDRLMPYVLLVSLHVAAAATVALIVEQMLEGAGPLLSILVSAAWVGAVVAYAARQSVLITVSLVFGSFLTIFGTDAVDVGNDFGLVFLWAVAIVTSLSAWARFVDEKDLALFMPSSIAGGWVVIVGLGLALEGAAAPVTGSLGFFSFPNQFSLLATVGLIAGLVIVRRRPIVTLAISVVVGLTQLVHYFAANLLVGGAPLWLSIESTLLAPVPAVILSFTALMSLEHQQRATGSEATD